MCERGPGMDSSRASGLAAANSSEISTSGRAPARRRTPTPPLPPPPQLVSSSRGGNAAATSGDRKRLGILTDKTWLKLPETSFVQTSNRKTRGLSGRSQKKAEDHPKKTWTVVRSPSHNNMCDTLQLNWKLGACQAGNSSAHRQVRYRYARIVEHGSFDYSVSCL